jgi:hypothetical protein
LVRAGGAGRGRAKGTPRVVEELVAETRHGSCDRGSVCMTQVGAGREETVKLAPQRDLSAAAEPANDGSNIRAVRRGCGADGRTVFDNRPGAHGHLAVDRRIVFHKRGQWIPDRRQRMIDSLIIHVHV